MKKSSRILLIGGVVVLLLGMFFLVGSSTAFVQDAFSIFLPLVLNGDSGSTETTPTPNPTSTSTPTGPTDTPTPTATNTPTPTATTDVFIPGETIYIPAGEFQMGCDSSNSDEICQSDEQPLHTVYLDAYYMDKYEVTNSLYAQCDAAGDCDPPSHNFSNHYSDYYDNPVYADYPVLYVSWYNADDYCTWAGNRLPTEAEWEKAARGSSDTRKFPWGNTSASCTLANYGGEYGCVGDTKQVGSYPLGASPYGLMDMAGNLGEWVADWYESDYYSTYPSDGWPSNPAGPASGNYRVGRGGSWNSAWTTIRSASRYGLYPDVRVTTMGFRCAQSP